MKKRVSAAIWAIAGLAALVVGEQQDAHPLIATAGCWLGASALFAWEAWMEERR